MDDIQTLKYKHLGLRSYVVELELYFNGSPYIDQKPSDVYSFIVINCFS